MRLISGWLRVLGACALVTVACSGSGDAGTGGTGDQARDGAAASAGTTSSGAGGASDGAVGSSGSAGISGNGGLGGNAGGTGNAGSGEAGGTAGAIGAGGAVTGGGGTAGTAGGGADTGGGGASGNPNSGGAAGGGQLDGSVGGAGARDAGSSGGAGGSTNLCKTAAECDDHDACDGVEVCMEGLCMPGAAPNCVDGNDCTLDSCDSVTGCVFTPLSGASCADGNACTSGDTCQAGVCVGTGQTVCNDGNPCTDDSCDSSTGCVFMNNTAACDDSSACTTGDVCAGGSCVGAAIVCDDGDPCTLDSCNPSSGCATAPTSGAACNDGNPCTSGDTCSAGSCSGTGTTTCNDGNPCTTDSCDPQVGCVATGNTLPCDDGNPCTSGDQCAGGACAGVSVTCDDGNECTTDSCSADGSCVHGVLADGVACSSDGNPCTLDTCLAGACHSPVPSGTVQCRSPSCQGTPPGAISTQVAFCDGTAQCPAPVTVPCSTDPCKADGSACQSGCGLDTDCPTGFYCSSGKCVGTLPNGNPCTRSAQCAQDRCVDGFCCNSACGGGVTTDCQACNVVAGTCTSLSGTSCSDGNACTTGQSCAAGTCAGGGATSCDDNNPCTADSCDPVTGCAHVPVTNGTSCSDGNACTTADSCVAGACVGGPSPSCDDANPCTDDSCSPATGCKHVNNTATCSDGNACTTGDACSAGSCKAGAAVACSDGNVCTTDTCNPASGCVFTNNTAACSDGNACTTGDTCAAGVCVGGPAPSCNDGNPCTSDSCSAATGCVHTNTPGPCSDGNACTTGDACAAGVCVGGTALACNDGNGCTTDTCSPGSGCVFTNNTAPCSDGDACTTGDACAGGSCQSGSPVACNDGNVCTNDSCNPASGCVFTNNTASCSDSNACTTADTCSGGVCVGGAAPNCDDGNPCTNDSCSAGSGCTHTNNTAPCNDGNACTTGDTCSGGACVGASVSCSDGVYCNGVETCNPLSGCVAGTPVSCPNTDGLSCTVEFCSESKKSCDVAPQDVRCDDGLFCDGVEQCKPSDPTHDTNGCVKGVAPPCDDGLPCTFNGCDNVAGACTFTPVNSLCDDNNKCNGAETCDPASGCVAGTPLTCGDGKLCTIDSCNPLVGCVYTPSNALCQDGLYCDGAEICSPASPGANAAGCIAGTAVSCPPTDAVACTQDVCDEPTDSCKVVFNNSLCSGGLSCTTLGCGKACLSNADCSDGLTCTGQELCDLSGGSPGQCKAGVPVVCDDGFSCTVDSCQEPSGACVFAPNNAACSDANLCNGVETCSPGVTANPLTGCLAGLAPNCNDGIACTNDGCLPSVGCAHTTDDGICQDSSVCNGSEACKPGAPTADSSGCVPAAAPLTCPDDGIACTQEKCVDAAGGCVSIPKNSLCPCAQTCDQKQGCGNFCVVSTCQGKVYQCGDCLDNDGDCGVDSISDPECLGPCSDNEAGFKGEIPGQDHGNCGTDCYFDQDSGTGNDGCQWSDDCDPLSLSTSTPPYTPSASNKCNYADNTASQTAQCNSWFSVQPTQCWSPGGTPPAANYCGALVPSGCDCFGCCVIPGAPTPVFLGSRPTANAVGTCTLSTVADPTKCYPCTQVPSCLNTCDHCEICIGKPTLPPDCTCQQCGAGQQLCGPPCGTPCPSGQFCLTGCCATNPG